MKWLLLVFLCLVSGIRAGEVSFWAWSRAEGLSDTEFASLGAIGTSSLFWQVGELEVGDEGLQWRHRYALPRLPSEIELSLVPVVRLASNVGAPETWDGIDLAKKIKELGLSSAEVQIDYDCPTSKLAVYAEHLKEVRAAFAGVRISVTALASWPTGGAGWKSLEGAVDALYPMFYDMRVEELGDFVPILDREEIDRWLPLWKDCEVKWVAGLPNFRRVSLYRDGKSVGHLREWRWEEVVFNESLTVSEARDSGLAVLHVAEKSRVGRTELLAGDQLVVREPDLKGLRDSRTRAEELGAAGVVYYELPMEGRATAGWSVSTLGGGVERIKVSWGKGRILLMNTGERDLGPRFLPRGHQLELRFPRGSLRELVAGDLAEARTSEDGALPLARSAVLWFEELRAGETLESELVQFASGVEIDAVEWRIGDGEWKKLEAN